MKMKEFLEDAEKELKEEQATMARETIKTRLREVRAAKKTVDRLEKSLEDLLARDVDEFSNDI